MNNSKCEKSISIDWKGTADYYEEENRKIKRDKFGDYLAWTVILIGLLFLIDMWAYLHYFIH